MTQKVPAAMADTDVATAASVTAVNSALDGRVTALENLKLTSGTSVATTSGTTVDFSSIPSTVKRITIMLSGVSLSGTALPRVQIGPSGTPETSGYLGTSGFIQNASSSGAGTISNGFDLISTSGAANLYNGMVILTLLDAATNTWAAMGVIAMSNSAVPAFMGGSKPLAGTLNIVRLTSSNGTDTFDAGKANILYE